VPDISLTEAYDQARHEFYALRYQEDVERRVAKEEALATGAYFGKSWLEVGMGLEDKMWESWKEWSLRESAAARQKRATAYTGLPDEGTKVEPGSDPTVDSVVEELGEGADLADVVEAPSVVP
jgi:small subunit ribosomal protein S23